MGQTPPSLAVKKKTFITCWRACGLLFWSKQFGQIGESQMNAIGVYDAKTQLPKLLDRVSRGERFLITRHGRPVAELVPARAEATPDVREIIRQMEEWQAREGPTLGQDLSIRQLREEGRRF
jgi:prevent-host-death family protein